MNDPASAGAAGRSVRATAKPGPPGSRGALRCPDPVALVLFGAGGDLARRKIYAALYRLAVDGLLPEELTLVGVDRPGMDDDSFRDAIRESVEGSDEVGKVEPEPLERLLGSAFFCGGDFRQNGTYDELGRRLGEVAPKAAASGGWLFYLAIPPSLFGDVIEHLSGSGLARRQAGPDEHPWVRLVVEKPFGRDLESARELDRLVGSSFDEGQIFRIDHYLGKETVQNLLVFRFGNSIFEPVWSREHVERVEITAAETLGVEHRAGYYERAGVLRDMFQNHLLQLLTLTAMEPPSTFRAAAVRNEKVKVLESVRCLGGTSPEEMDRHLVVGQYGAGEIDGTAVPAYRAEPGVDEASTTPTYGAVRLEIDSWRWRGVPFLLRSGKRLRRRATEIVLRFRRPPLQLFDHQHRGGAPGANVLVLRIQPDEGIRLRFEVKHPGVEVAPSPVMMDFSYAGSFGEGSYPAYETLLLDAMLGDATLFPRADEVEAAWRVMDPFIRAVEEHPPAELPNYAAGSWGPAAADRLTGGRGGWREP